jgi:hypothetical protein
VAGVPVVAASLFVRVVLPMVVRVVLPMVVRPSHDSLYSGGG